METLHYVIPATSYPRYDNSKRHISCIQERFKILMNDLQLDCSDYVILEYGDVDIFVTRGDKTNEYVDDKFLELKQSENVKIENKGKSTFRDIEDLVKRNAVTDLSPKLVVVSISSVSEVEPYSKYPHNVVIVAEDVSLVDQIKHKIGTSDENVLQISVQKTLGNTICLMLERIVFRNLREPVEALKGLSDVAKKEYIGKLVTEDIKETMTSTLKDDHCFRGWLEELDGSYISTLTPELANCIPTDSVPLDILRKLRAIDRFESHNPGLPERTQSFDQSSENINSGRYTKGNEVLYYLVYKLASLIGITTEQSILAKYRKLPHIMRDILRLNPDFGTIRKIMTDHVCELFVTLHIGNIEVEKGEDAKDILHVFLRSNTSRIMREITKITEQLEIVETVDKVQARVKKCDDRSKARLLGDIIGMYNRSNVPKFERPLIGPRKGNRMNEKILQHLFECVKEVKGYIYSNDTLYICVDEIREDIHMAIDRILVSHNIPEYTVTMHTEATFLEYGDQVRVISSATSESVSFPEEILRMDRSSIDLYKQALSEREEAVHTIRVMVVGQFDVGKTALTKRLLGEDVDISARESTNGIEVHVRRCKVSLKDGQWTMLTRDETKENIHKRLATLLNQYRVNENMDTMSLRADPSSIKVYLHGDVTDALKKEETLEADTMQQAQSIRQANVPIVTDTCPVINLSVEQVMTGYSDKTQTDEEKTIMRDLKEIVKMKDGTSTLEGEEVFADLSIWDFAGQYPFYSTHQVFLSPRAVYLLVTDISKHIDDVVIGDTCYFDSNGPKACEISGFVEFWLNAIHVHCPSTQTGVPPVILIGTHADKLDKRRKDDLSQAYFEALRNFLSGKVTQDHLADEDFAVDNTQVDPTLDALKKKILEVASQQYYWGELMPARWLTLEKELVELKDSGLKITKRKEIQKINRAMPIPIGTTEELSLFLRFQHDSGNIIYFSEDEDLNDLVLLNPQWLADAFKCILTAKMFCIRKPRIYEKWQEFDKSAKLKWDLIDAVWMQKENESFHEHRTELIAFFEKLDIIAKPCLFNDDGSDTMVQEYFFAPSVIKEPPPVDIINPCRSTFISTNTLCFTLSTKFTPIAIFHRLLASCIARWPISRRQGSKEMIYCVCGVFDIDVRASHRLTLYFSEHVIQIWLTKYSSTDPQPSLSVCVDVRKFVEKALQRIKSQVCPSSELVRYVKCPEVGVSIGGLHEVTDLLNCKEIDIPCNCQTDMHVLKRSEMLMYWFPETSGQSGQEDSGIQCANMQPINAETYVSTTEQGNIRVHGENKRIRPRKTLPNLPKGLPHHELIKRSIKKNTILLKKDMNPEKMLDLFEKKEMFVESNYIRDIREQTTTTTRNTEILHVLHRQSSETLELFKDCLFESDATGNLINSIELAEDAIITQFKQDAEDELRPDY